MRHNDATVLNCARNNKMKRQSFDLEKLQKKINNYVQKRCIGKHVFIDSNLSKNNLNYTFEIIISINPE